MSKPLEVMDEGDGGGGIARHRQPWPRCFLALPLDVGICFLVSLLSLGSDCALPFAPWAELV